MKKLITLLVVLILIVGAAFGYYFYEENKEPDANEEVISPSELFDVSGNQVAIMFNNILQDPKGLYKDELVYLPLKWVKERLNDRFYWDESVEKLIYTTPAEILYSDLSSTNSQGKQLLIKDGEDLYLSVSLLSTYCNISCKNFISDDAKRIFIEDNWKTYETAALTKEAVLRTGRSDMQRIIVPLAKNERVRIIRDFESDPEPQDTEETEPWCRILTDDGFTGYVLKKYLDDYDTVSPKSAFVEPSYTHILLSQPVVLAWHQTTSLSSNDGISDLIKNAAPVNVIAPTWFSLSDNNGGVTSIISDDYVNLLHEKNIQVWALVDNFSEEINTESILKNAAAREAVISKLIAEVTEHHIDGINIDFERLPESSAEAFIQFIRELSISCRNNGIVLSVDNPNAQLGNLFYNRNAQAECVDYVVNMGYDEHYAGGEPGSVSSYPFFKEGIDLTLEEVPSNQIIAGIPFYTRIWTEEGAEITSTAVGLGTAADWVNENGIELTWDNDLGQYTGANETSQIWLEDRDSLELKLNYVYDSKLAGIGCWKLGLEAADTWEFVHIP